MRHFLLATVIFSLVAVTPAVAGDEGAPLPTVVEAVAPVTRPVDPPKRVTQPKAPSPQAAAPMGQWVEVRLPDGRRAWAQTESLVIGSWQPQGPERLVELAGHFQGVPYRYGGVDPNGYDCSGFVQEVFRLAGYQVPRMADAQFEELERVDREDLSVGDLVFFDIDGSGISHVGIFVGEGRFLHASSSMGVVESHLEEEYYARRFAGAARLAEWERVVGLGEK